MTIGLCSDNASKFNEIRQKKSILFHALFPIFTLNVSEHVYFINILFGLATVKKYFLLKNKSLASRALMNVNSTVDTKRIVFDSRFYGYLIKALKNGNQQSLPHQQELVAAANRLIDQTHNLASPIIRSKLTTGLEFATRLTASNASQLAALSEEAARRTRSSQFRVSTVL